MRTSRSVAVQPDAAPFAAANNLDIERVESVKPQRLDDCFLGGETRCQIQGRFRLAGTIDPLTGME